MEPQSVLRSNTGTGAMAGSPADVLEPVVKALGRLARRKISIAAYFSNTKERDALSQVVKNAVQELGIEQAVDVKLRPWWVFWWMPLFVSGAWHAPILTMNGKVFSQGVVPNKEALKETLLKNIGV